MTQSEDTLNLIIKHKPSRINMKQWFKYLEKYKPIQIDKELWLDLIEVANMRDLINSNAH